MPNPKVLKIPVLRRSGYWKSFSASRSFIRPSGWNKSNFVNP